MVDCISVSVCLMLVVSVVVCLVMIRCGLWWLNRWMLSWVFSVCMCWLIVVGVIVSLFVVCEKLLCFM